MKQILLLVIFCQCGSALLRAAENLDNGIYVYHAFRKGSNCATTMARLNRLRLPTMAILSVEEGPEFLLDRPGGEALLACVLEKLRASSHTVKLLMLQDTVFLQQTDEAIRRAGKIGEFAAAYPGLLAGVQLDIEPHQTKQWASGEADQRRILLDSFYQLLNQIRPQLHGLPLGLVVPWWYLANTKELPEGAVQTLFSAADEIYLMIYGDPDQPSEDSVTDRLRPSLNAAAWVSRQHRVYVVLATHEYSSMANLEADLNAVRRFLNSWPCFAGTAIFHATSAFASNASPSLHAIVAEFPPTSQRTLANR